MARPEKDPMLKSIRKQVSVSRALWEAVCRVEPGLVAGEASPSAIFQEGCRARVTAARRKESCNAAATHFLIQLSDALNVIEDAFENGYEENGDEPGDGDGAKDAEFSLARLLWDIENKLKSLDPELLRAAEELKGHMSNLVAGRAGKKRNG